MFEPSYPETFNKLYWFYYTSIVYWDDSGETQEAYLVLASGIEDDLYTRAEEGHNLLMSGEVPFISLPETGGRFLNINSVISIGPIESVYKNYIATIDE